MFFLRLISYLPFGVLYRLSDFLFFISYRVLKYRRNIVWRNLKNSFPEKPEMELRKIEKQFYANLCDYGVETLKLLTMSKAELSKRMPYVNADLLNPYSHQQQSVILLASHQFNWEWLVTSGSINLPMHIDYIYQKQSSELFDRFSTVVRTRFGAYPIERQSTAREAIKRKSILRAIAIVVDQFPTFEKRYWTTFLSQDTAFFRGIGQLTTLTQYPAFYVESKKIKRGYYQARLIPLASPPFEKGSEEVVDKYVASLEKSIQELPANWLWSHARWKENMPVS